MLPHVFEKRAVMQTRIDGRSAATPAAPETPAHLLDLASGQDSGVGRNGTRPALVAQLLIWLGRDSSGTPRTVEGADVRTGGIVSLPRSLDVPLAASSLVGGSWWLTWVDGAAPDRIGSVTAVDVSADRSRVACSGAPVAKGQVSQLVQLSQVIGDLAVGRDATGAVLIDLSGTRSLVVPGDAGLLVADGRLWALLVDRSAGDSATPVLRPLGPAAVPTC